MTINEYGVSLQYTLWYFNFSFKSNWFLTNYKNPNACFNKFHYIDFIFLRKETRNNLQYFLVQEQSWHSFAMIMVNHEFSMCLYNILKLFHVFLTNTVFCIILIYINAIVKYIFLNLFYSELLYKDNYILLLICIFCKAVRWLSCDNDTIYLK
jgi:hypothetical protein